MEINVTVNAESLDLSTVIDGETYGDTRPRTLGDLVAEKLADRLYGQYTREETYEARQRVDVQRDALIRAAVAPVIERALTEPMRQTDAYGSPIGEPTTLRTLIAKQATAALTAKSDRYSREPTIIEKIVGEQINAAFRNELAGLVKTERDKVVKAVRDNAATIIANAVKQGLSAR